VFKFFKWMITEVNSEGWKILYYGACLGAVLCALFLFPFRYHVLEVNNNHMAPIWLKVDRLTGTTWKSIGFSSEWFLVTNHVDSVSASTNSPDWAK